MFPAMGDGLLNIEGAAGEGAHAFEMLIWLQSEEASM